jgi:hypothetical protein
MHRFLFALGLGTLGLALIGAVAPSAEAVMIASGDGSGNITAPPGNPAAWADMAYFENGSSVYLGNRWMITANHVDTSTIGNTSVQFTDGRSFNTVVGSGIQLSNKGVFADLKMFRLTADPGLPALPVATAEPSVGSKVTMIGAGENRFSNEFGFSIDASLNLIQTPLISASLRGFVLDSSSFFMRWGTSTVQGLNSVSQNPTTLTFNTQFHSTGNPFEGQAVPGDSGGGTFQFVNGSWQLAGIIVDRGFSTSANNNNNVVIFGDTSISADLFEYRTQIESILNNPSDVDMSGLVSPDDALLIVNSLNQFGAHAFKPGEIRLDANGDGQVNAADFLFVIDAILAQKGTPAAIPAAGLAGLASPNLTQVPEPSTGVLAVLGLLVVTLGRRAVLVRRKR